MVFSFLMVTLRDLKLLLLPYLHTNLHSICERTAVEGECGGVAITLRLPVRLFIRVLDVSVLLS